MDRTPTRTRTPARRTFLRASCLLLGAGLLALAPAGAADHVDLATPVGAVRAHQEGTGASAGADLMANTGAAGLPLPVAGAAGLSAGASASPSGASVHASPGAAASGIGGGSTSASASATAPATPEPPELPTGFEGIVTKAVQWIKSLF